MARRTRLRRVTRKPFKVWIDGKVEHEVYSPEEYEKVLKGIDRKKRKVRLR
jgi:hypothetical protein